MSGCLHFAAVISSLLQKWYERYGSPASFLSGFFTTQEKGEKINVRRFKQKVRYRKSTGFRPLVTKLEIVSIG